MTRWGLALGALALLLAFVGTRTAGSPSAASQSATPAANAGTGGALDPTATDPYRDFLAKLTTNLGVGDAATVDAAIRTTLKRTLDERRAAGDLSAAEATAIKARIDAAEVPLGPIGGHRGGFDRGGFGGPFGGRDRGGFAPGGPFEGRGRDDRNDREDGPADEDDPTDAESGLPETSAPAAAATPTL